MPKDPKPRRDDDSWEDREIHPSPDSPTFSNTYPRPEPPLPPPPDLSAYPPEQRKKILDAWKKGKKYLTE